jgi:endoglucanase
LNRTLRGKGRGVTGSGSRLGVGVASLLIWLVLLLVFSLGVAGKSGGAETGSVQIKVDQVGYLPDGETVAVVTAAAKTFEVKRASDNVAVSSGALGPASADADSGDSVQIANFTKLREAETYYLDVPGVGRSWTFAIKRDVSLHTDYLVIWR